MKFISTALLLILSAAITQSAPQSDCQIVQEAYKTATRSKKSPDCEGIPEITYDKKQQEKVTEM